MVVVGLTGVLGPHSGLRKPEWGPNTPVRPTTNFRFNEHPPLFLSHSFFSPRVSPLYFSWKKPGDLFLIASFTRCHPCLFSSEKLTTFFAHHCNFLLISLGFHPPPLESVTRTFFYLSDLILSTILCKVAHNFFSFGCHPLEGVIRVGPPPPLDPPLPLSDATGPIYCCRL